MDFVQIISPYQALFFNIIQALILIAVGLVVARVAVKVSDRLSVKLISPHHQILLRKAIYWLIFFLFLVSALYQLGFKVGVLLGTAGVISVALGFAAQTSASNLISGLFVLSEESFKIGDVISVGSTTGEVLSIDLLSVKLRTFDNVYVRIPNEQMIKSEVKTITRFPIRRFDLNVGIAYRSDINQARQVLLDVAKRNPLCLDDPAPVVVLQGFNSSSIDILFAIWSTRENFLALKNSMQEEVKLAFDRAGIEIPFPHITFYTGANCAPLPIKLVDPSESDRQEKQQARQPDQPGQDSQAEHDQQAELAKQSEYGVTR